jgi:hypothetical protein
MSKNLTPRKSDGKYMIQVLLPHAQGDFYVKYIEEELERKVNAFTKDLVINFIKGVCSKTEYERMKRQDDKDWNEAVKQRVKTRYKTKKQNQSTPKES